MGEFDPSKCFQQCFDIVGGILVCAGCSLGFKQLLGKEGDVKWRYFQAVLAGPAVHLKQEQDVV